MVLCKVSFNILLWAALLNLIHGKLGILRVFPGHKQEHVDLCFYYNSDWVRLPTQPLPIRPLFAPKQKMACGNMEEEKDTINMTAVLVDRGKCSFLDKIRNIQREGGVGVVIANDDDMAVTPFIAKEDQGLVRVPTGSVSQSDGQQLRQYLQDGNIPLVSFFSPSVSKFDVNMFLMGLYATIVLTIGCYVSNYKPFSKTTRGIYREDNSENVATERELFDVNFKGVIMMIMGMSIVLVLLFVLYRYLVYAMIFSFCLGSLSSIFLLFSSIFDRAPCGNVFRTPVILVDINVKDILISIVSGVIVITWFIGRKSIWSWILQDILGASLIINILHTVRLPSLKVSTFLLCSFVVYDVFMVFITPLLTPSGDSVMVKVATGVAEVGEEMPMMLKMPYYKPAYVVQVCQLGTSYTLLGFGDVVVPGLFLNYLLSCDMALEENVKHNGCYRLPTYFLAGVVSYFLGLCFTDIAMINMELPQPALLYLVPFTLIPAIWQAKIRGELGMMWAGNCLPVEYELLGENMSMNSLTGNVREDGDRSD